MLIGINGKANRGKQQLAERIAAELGNFRIVNTDELAMELYQTNDTFKEKLVKAFGTDEFLEVSKITHESKVDLFQLYDILFEYLIPMLDRNISSRDTIVVSTFLNHLPLIDKCDTTIWVVGDEFEINNDLDYNYTYIMHADANLAELDTPEPVL